MHLIQSLKNEFCFDLPMFTKYPATSINSYFYKMTLCLEIQMINYHDYAFRLNIEEKCKNFTSIWEGAFTKTMTLWIWEFAQYAYPRTSFLHVHPWIKPSAGADSSPRSSQFLKKISLRNEKCAVRLVILYFEYFILQAGFEFYSCFVMI